MHYGRTEADEGKRLRFIDTGKNRSAPSTPCTSPTIPDLSLPEDEEPRAPRLRPIPLPLVDEVVQLHHVLAFRSDNGLPLVYSVSTPPSMVTTGPRCDINPADLPRVLGQAATEPPQPLMTLVSNAFPSSWAISVIPRSCAYVTVFDVLASVYAFLRMPLSRPEFAELAVTRAARVAEAYHRRVGEVTDDTEYHEEQVKGVKRVDLLVGDDQTVFAGLSSMEASQDVWKLHLT